MLDERSMVEKVTEWIVQIVLLILVVWLLFYNNREREEDEKDFGNYGDAIDTSSNWVRD